MMSNSFQNPLQAIKSKSQENWSGCVEVIEPKDPSISWQVYLLQGKIQYISISAGQQSRLNYLWQQLGIGGNCPKLDNSQQKNSEYSQLCNWLKTKQLSDDKIKKALFMFVREGLVNVLSIRETRIEFKPAKRIPKSIISFDYKKLISHEPIKIQIRTYQEMRQYLHSLASRLYLEQKNALKFYKIWKELYTKAELKKLASSQKLSSFVSFFVAKNNLYEIATKGKVDACFLAQYLKQPIEEKILQQLPFSEALVQQIDIKSQDNDLNSTLKNQGNKSEINTTQSQLSSLVVCIDDSKTVQKQVKLTLKAAGYEVLGISDPTMALKDLSQLEPAVIFMDINMPDINGYDLCALLRRSQKFKEIPIVMLTGRDGMIDRVRAKIAGANDYLTKPCDPNKLIAMVKILEKSVATIQ